MKLDKDFVKKYKEFSPYNHMNNESKYLEFHYKQKELVNNYFNVSSIEKNSIAHIFGLLDYYFFEKSFEETHSNNEKKFYYLGLL